MEELIPIVGVLSVFGWLSFNSYWKNKTRIEELRAQNPSQNAEANARQNKTAAPLSASEAGELAALRREVQELRDTTTRFDLSFDAALERLERRMDYAEGQQVPAAAPQTPVAPTPQTVVTQPVGEADRQTLRAGAGR